MNKQELIDELKKEIEATKNVSNFEEHVNLYGKGKRVGLEFGWMLAEKLDEPEITEEQAWRVIAETHNQDEMYWLDAKNHYLNSSNEPELPVIPQLVADWIETTKKSRWGMLMLFDTNEMPNEEVDSWLTNADDGPKNSELAARAWLDDYTIEPEKKVRIAVGKLDGTYFRTELPESEARKLIKGWKDNE